MLFSVSPLFTLIFAGRGSFFGATLGASLCAGAIVDGGGAGSLFGAGSTVFGASGFGASVFTGAGSTAFGAGAGAVFAASVFGASAFAASVFAAAAAPDATAVLFAAVGAGGVVIASFSVS